MPRRRTAGLAGVITSAGAGGARIPTPEVRRSLLSPTRWVPLLSLAIAASASAVIIASGDGSGNTTPPSPDPGFYNLGTRNGGAFGVVYLGNGWVLTANHVGAGDTVFSGVPYPWLSGTDVQLQNPDNSPADLVVFRLAQPYPPLPTLPIATATPSVDVIMIGNGPDRGTATSWMGHQGWYWVVPSETIRWGTNDPDGPAAFNAGLPLPTVVFTTLFDQFGGGHTTYEAQAAVGDSGGAVLRAAISQES